MLTLVVVASALHRMDLYQDAYGFTQLRLLVDVFEGWLGLLVLAVMVAGAVGRGAWLPRFALVSGAVALLGLAAINPDAWIARHNIDRYEATGRIDWTYLRDLSADATPVIADRLPPRSPAACCSTCRTTRCAPRPSTTRGRGTWAGAAPRGRSPTSACSRPATRRRTTSGGASRPTSAVTSGRPSGSQHPDRGHEPTISAPRTWSVGQLTSPGPGSPGRPDAHPLLESAANCRRRAKAHFPDPAAI